MAQFHYVALNQDGETVEGEIESASEADVISQLQNAGLYPIRTGLAGASTRSKRFRKTRKAFDQKSLSLFTSKLAVMLKAGLPLDNALHMLIELMPESAEKMLNKIRDDIQHGEALSESLAQFPNEFDAYYVSTIRAGETAGALETVLQRLTHYLERRQALRETIISALTYPAILLVVAIISVGILLAYVVPHFAELYDGIDQTLPISTSIVIGISSLFRDYWWLCLIVITLAVITFQRYYNSANGKAQCDAFFLRIPLIGDLITKVEVARFSRTLSTLLDNGVPLLNSLAIVQDVVSNTPIKNAVTQVTTELREGKNIAPPLKETGVFPNMAINLIHVGEETGELEKMLDQVANIYEDEVKSAVSRLLALLGPVIIIGLGVIIAFIIFSVLLAILGLNDFV